MNHAGLTRTCCSQPSQSNPHKEPDKSGTFRKWPIVVSWTLGAVTPMVEDWLQQIPQIPVQKSSVLGTAKVPHRTLKYPGLEQVRVSQYYQGQSPAGVSLLPSSSCFNLGSWEPFFYRSTSQFFCSWALFKGQQSLPKYCSNYTFAIYQVHSYFSGVYMLGPFDRVRIKCDLCGLWLVSQPSFHLS